MSKKIYDILAQDYHRKRFSKNKDLETFVKEIKEKEISFTGYNIDLGCANGRNFKVFLQSNIKLIGIDNSIEFLKISRNRIATGNNYTMKERRSIELIQSDILFLPIRPNVIQNIFSIATIHHIKDKTQLNYAISQLYCLLRDKGYFLFTVWRKYQKNYRSYFIKDKIKRLFNPKYRKVQKNLGLNEYGDKFVPWTLSAEKKTYNRFYHFFSGKELKKMLRSFVIKEMTKRGGPNKKDNFFVLAKKKSEVKKVKIT